LRKACCGSSHNAQVVNLAARAELHVWPAGLSQSDKLKDPALVSFLDYLQYWLKPEYASYVM